MKNSFQSEYHTIGALCEYKATYIAGEGATESKPNVRYAKAAVRRRDKWPRAGTGGFQKPTEWQRSPTEQTSKSGSHARKLARKKLQRENGM